MLQVAHEAVAGGVEGDAEGEAVRRAHALDLAAVGGDAQQFAELVAAPDRAVGVDGDAFGMSDARVGEDAVEEDAGSADRQQGVIALSLKRLRLRCDSGW